MPLISLTSLLLVTTILLSTSMNLTFLAFIYKMVQFFSLCLVYFTYHNILQVHSCCKCQDPPFEG